MAASDDLGVVTVARLIDLSTLGIGERNPNAFNDPERAHGWNDLLKILEAAPTVDAVEVVRCRDCKHRGTDYCIFHIKGEPADEELLGKLDNDFCSYGERKDNV